MSLLPLSPPVFSILSGVVAERAGLHFDTSHLQVFAEKACARAVEAGFESMLDYYYYLRYDPGGARELSGLVEALVVGETYLFRELPPLETAVSAFVEPLLAAGKRPRIWSAACATGEEPHTLSMLLAARGLLDQVDLVASDINASALQRARTGRFSRRSVRQAVPPFASPWLEITEGAVSVKPPITSAIEWRQLNLIDGDAVAALGTFDVILCRNVLIYFSDDTVRRVVGRLIASLNPGGALFVGVSESLLRFGLPLLCEEQNGIFLYRKAA